MDMLNIIFIAILLGSSLGFVVGICKEIFTERTNKIFKLKIINLMYVYLKSIYKNNPNILLILVGCSVGLLVAYIVSILIAVPILLGFEELYIFVFEILLFLASLSGAKYVCKKEWLKHALYK